MLLNQRKSIDWVPLIVIFTLGLTVSFVPLFMGGIFEANDLVSFYLKTTLHFTEQFWSGDLYPRWLIDMNGGLGSPLFFFHSPLVYYITSFFSAIFKDARGWFPLVLTASSALIFSGFTCFLWLKDITNRAVALFGAIVYMLFPYHLVVDVYWRFSLTEQWVFVWLPLLLYFTIKIIQNQRFSLMSYAICYAALVLTQLSAALIFTIVPLSYSLILTKKDWRIFLRLLAATTIGIGLSAIYWYPAWLMQDNVSIKTNEIFFYANNFLFHFPNEVLDPQLCKYLEIISILTVVIAGCAWGIARYNFMPEYVMESHYWFALAGFSIFMSTPLSQPIWIILPPLQSISFPWIFNIILLLSTVSLLSLALYTIENPLSILIDKPVRIAIYIIGALVLGSLEILPLYANTDNFLLSKLNNTILIICLTLLIGLGISFIKIMIDFSHHKILVFVVLLIASLIFSSAIIIPQRISNKARNITQELTVSMDSAKYRPSWVSDKFFNMGYLKYYTKDPNKTKFISGKGSIKTTYWKPRNILFQVETNKDAVIKVNQYYYPGWKATTINQKERKLIPVKPSDNDGLIQINLPSGRYELHLTLEVTGIEKTGQIITGLSCLGLIGWPAYSYYKRQSLSKRVTPETSKEKIDYS